MQMMRVADRNVGFNSSSVCENLQNVCDDTNVKVDVKLAPIIVSGVPPDGGPRPGSILNILHGADD